MVLRVNMGRPLAHSNASRPTSLAAVRRSAVCSDAEATPPRSRQRKSCQSEPARTGRVLTSPGSQESSAWARPPRQGRHPWDRVPSATEDDAVQALDDQRTHGRSVSPPPRPGRSPGHLGQEQSPASGTRRHGSRAVGRPDSPHPRETQPVGGLFDSEKSQCFSGIPAAPTIDPRGPVFRQIAPACARA